MKNFSNLIMPLTAIIFLLLASTNTLASHNAGGSLTYHYSGTPNNYIVTYKFYRDCSGIPAPSQINICYSTATCSLSGTFMLYPVAGTGIPITLGPCIGTNGPTTCQGGSAIGIEEWIFSGSVTLPAACVDWIFEYEECCRNSLTNILGQPGMYLYTTLDNVNFPTNSSPQYIFPSYSQHCILSNTNRSFACMDIDGDSLVYELESALDGSGTCPYITQNCTYLAPYTSFTPFSSSTPIALDPVTGIMNFTPDILQQAAVAVVVKEYSNGLLKGKTHSDNYLSTINGLVATDEMKGKVYHDTNANGIYDAGEPGMANQIISIQPGPYYYSSNFNGDYNALLPVGSYTATTSTYYPFYYFTPSSNTAIFTAGYMIDSLNDFGMEINYNVQDLRISLTGPNVRPAMQSYLGLTATNFGSVTMNATINLILDPDILYISASPVPAFVSGDTVCWAVTNLQMLQSQNFFVTVNIANVPVGSILNSVAEILPLASDTTPSDNVDSLAQPVVNSCDPNYKTVSPDDYITTTQVLNGLYLEYTIYFQNTGTAPAINIDIVDTLDANFDIPSLEIIGASHLYAWSITGQGVLTFSFANIYLPDSNANEPASHGFIKYRIKPSTNFANYYKLVNEAWIYFDNNLPVLTNYTSTHVYNFTSIIKTEKGNRITVFPNPANSEITIETKNGTINEIKLMDLTGKAVYSLKTPINKYTNKLDITPFAKGIYFIKINTTEGDYVKKVVVQ